MPPIHTAEHVRPVDDKQAKQAYDQLVAMGYPKQDANDHIRALRAKYHVDSIRARGGVVRRPPPAPPMPSLRDPPPAPPMPQEESVTLIRPQFRRAPAAPPMPDLPPGY